MHGMQRLRTNHNMFVGLGKNAEAKPAAAEEVQGRTGSFFSGN